MTAYGMDKTKLRAGMLASLYGEAYALHTTSLNSSQINHWRHKYEEHDVSTRDGARNWKFTESQQYFVEGVLWVQNEEHPDWNPKELVDELHKLGLVNVTINWVVRCLGRWNYSLKPIYYVQ